MTNPSHRNAVLLALLVTFLWSTSWVLIKFGLQDMPALTFAGLRYTLAFVCLLGYLAARRQLHLSRLSRTQWLRLFLLGIIFYTLAQGGQFLALAHLPAVATNLIISFSSIPVALLGTAMLKEHLNPVQWLGVLMSVAGGAIFFLPLENAAYSWIGWAAALLAMLSTSAGSLFTRSVNRRGDLDPLTITVVSMGFGGLGLLGAGLTTQGLPSLSLQNIGIIIWLAVANTALAFALWNVAARTLTAAESSVIANLMLVLIPIMAVIFLQENLNGKELVGMAVNILGLMAVQLGLRVGGRPARSPAFPHQSSNPNREQNE